jgi:protein XagA
VHRKNGLSGSRGIWATVKRGLVQFFCSAAFLSSPLLLRAEAWTQEAGHGQFILTASFFDIGTYFNQASKIEPLDYAGRFRKFELNPYLEYGLTSRFTAVLNVRIPFLEYSNEFNLQRSAGFGDIEIGLRRRFNSMESPTVLSGQLSVLFPTYPADLNPPPGNHQVDVEARFIVGRGITITHRHAFWEFAAAYRYRSEQPADQFRSDATFGIDLTPRLMLLAQYFGITGLQNGEPFQIGSNPNLQSDFDLYKAQLSVVIRTPHKTRFQVGWLDAFAGRNTGHGQELLIAIWKDF